MIKIIFISLIIYIINFIMLGNTFFRLDAYGNTQIHFLSLIEGFIGPLRTLILMIKYSEAKIIIKYLYEELFRLSNPYSAFIFTIYFYNLINKNLFLQKGH